MLMTTVVAVALGYAPIQQDGSVAPSRDNYASMVGAFTQSIDRSGTTHLRGYSRFTGAPYDLKVRTDGKVEGDVGNFYVTFNVKEVA
jgi:hypothetical protein